LKDAHYRENNELYHFIADMLRPPATLEVHTRIFDHLPFYVDIGKNFVETLSNDEASQLAELKIKVKKNVMKNLTKQLKIERAGEDDPALPRFQILSENIVNENMMQERAYQNAIHFSSEKNPLGVVRRDKDSGGRILDNI
jgi:hypothetical protein